ncbi:nuclease-related domain-containing protein [Lacisediminihabitans sp. FW035]
MTSTEDTAQHTDFAGIQALSSRAAGYSVARKCLEVQSQAESRDPSLRTPARVALHDDAWPWYQGALGEMEVGRLLSDLGPEWFVRHAVPIGAGTKDVDHLVIGPGGVFAINTKHHAGAKVWVVDYMLGVNNSKTRHLSDGRRDAIDVATRLSAKAEFPVEVRPVIALVDPVSVIDRRAPLNRPVAVLDARKLVAWLRSQPRQLSDTKLSLLKLAAEEPETWHIDREAANTLRVMPRFERLIADVGTPSRPRTATPRSRTTLTPRRSRPARTSRPTRTTPAARKGTRGPSAVDLVKLWFAVAFIVIGIFTFRSIANQPCVPAVSCLIPPLYLGVKPLLMLAGAAAIGFGGLATVRWLVRTVGR